MAAPAMIANTTYRRIAVFISNLHAVWVCDLITAFEIRVIILIRLQKLTKIYKSAGQRRTDPCVLLKVFSFFAADGLLSTAKPVEIQGCPRTPADPVHEVPPEGEDGILLAAPHGEIAIIPEDPGARIQHQQPARKQRKDRARLQSRRRICKTITVRNQGDFQ